MDKLLERTTDLEGARGGTATGVQAGSQAESRGAVATVAERPVFELRDLSLSYGKASALDRISMSVPANQITAFIGPSGCGKSSLLRCLRSIGSTTSTAASAARSNPARRGSSLRTA